RRLKRRSADNTYQRCRFDMPCVELAFRAFRTAVPVPERFVRDPGLLCTFVSAGTVATVPVRFLLRSSLHLRRLLIRVCRCLLCRRIRLSIAEDVPCLLSSGARQNPPQLSDRGLLVFRQFAQVEQRLRYRADEFAIL